MFFVCVIGLSICECQPEILNDFSWLSELLENV